MLTIHAAKCIPHAITFYALRQPTAITHANLVRVASELAAKDRRHIVVAFADVVVTLLARQRLRTLFALSIGARLLRTHSERSEQALAFLYVCTEHGVVPCEVILYHGLYHGLYRAAWHYKSRLGWRERSGGC